MGWFSKWRGKEQDVSSEELPDRPEDPEAAVLPPDNDAPEPECVDPSDPYNS